MLISPYFWVFQFACSFSALKRNLEMCVTLVKLSDHPRWKKFHFSKFLSGKSNLSTFSYGIRYWIKVYILGRLI